MDRPTRLSRPDVDALPPTEPITVPIVDAPAPVTGRAVWVEVEAGLHVASTEEYFVGTVTRTTDGYSASDGAGRRRGTFADLVAAKEALERCAAQSTAAPPALTRPLSRAESAPARAENMRRSPRRRGLLTAP